MGDSLLQKTYTADFLTKKQVRNEGQITQYYVKDSHTGIIPRDEWNAVQQEMERLEAYKEEHHITHYGYGGDVRPFTAKIVCGECGCIYGRKAHKNRPQKMYWQCNTRCNKGPKACKSENVPESTIHQVFIDAWNTIVRDRKKMNQRWEKQEKEGTELEQLRARQMQELAEQGPLTEIVPELVQTVLESITVKGDGNFEIRFLDGSLFAVTV